MQHPGMIFRTFSQTIDSLRKGRLGDEVDEQLAALVLQCMETGKAGEITLKLKLKPSKDGPMEVFDDLTVKMPKVERGSTFVYATPEGHLSRNDPRQGEIEAVRVVESDDTPIRRLAAAG